MSLVVAAFAMASQSLALAGDGSFYLVEIIANGDVFSTDERYLGNALRQAPALLGVHAGVTSTYVLSLLQGIGQLVLPALVWSLAILFSRADRVVFAAVAGTAGICAGTTWFFSVSETVIAMPLTTLVAVLLWQPRSWAWHHVALAVGAALVLVASYETSIATGAILAAWAGMRALRSTVPRETLASALVAALAVLSVQAGVHGFGNVTSGAHSRSFLYFIVTLEPWPLYAFIAGMAVVVAGAGPWFQRELRRALLASGTVVLVVALASLDISTYSAFAARGGVVIPVVLLQLFLWWLWATRRAPSAQAERSGWLVAIPVLFVVGILTVNLWAMREWSRSLAGFRSAVDTAHGVVLAKNVIPVGRRDVVWNWTTPSLSLIVRRRPDSGVIFDPSPGYLPFPPEQARTQIRDEYVWDR